MCCQTKGPVHGSVIRGAALCDLLVFRFSFWTLWCSGKDTILIFTQSYWAAFAQTGEDMVHINTIMRQETYVYFRSRIYSRNVLSFVSPFYKVTKDVKDYWKLSTTHYFAKEGTVWWSSNWGIDGGERMPSALHCKHCKKKKKNSKIPKY